MTDTPLSPIEVLTLVGLSERPRYGYELVDVALTAVQTRWRGREGGGAEGSWTVGSTVERGRTEASPGSGPR